MYSCSFSGNPLFFAALLLALVKAFADKEVRIVNPYFFLYSFRLMPWETRCLTVSCIISFPHSRQITLSFWIESCGVSAWGCGDSCVLGSWISPDSALCSSWRVPKTCRREDAMSVAVMEDLDAWVWTISDAISMSFLGIGESFGVKVNVIQGSEDHLFYKVSTRMQCFSKTCCSSCH